MTDFMRALFLYLFSIDFSKIYKNQLNSEADRYLYFSISKSRIVRNATKLSSVD